MTTEKKILTNRYCVAPGCANCETLSSKNIFHSFPNDNILRTRWFEFIGRKDTNINHNDLKNWTICSEHFDINDYENDCYLESVGGNYKRIERRLKANIVPYKQNAINKDDNLTNFHPQLEDQLRNIFDNEYNFISILDDEDELPNPPKPAEVEDNKEDKDIHSKCGEIFVSQKGEFLYFCTVCNKHLKTSEQFSHHIFSTHLNSDEFPPKPKGKTGNHIDETTYEHKNGTHFNRSSSSSLDVDVIETNNGNFQTISYFDLTEQKPVISEIPITVGPVVTSANEIFKRERSASISTDTAPSDTESDLIVVTDINEYHEDVPSEAILNNNNKISTSINKGNTSHNNQVFKEKSNNKFEEEHRNQLEIEIDPHDFDWKPYKSNKKTKKMKCYYCPKYLKSQQSYEYHIRTHTGENPFVCSKCNKGFKLLSLLKVHEKQHEPKRYRCDECDQGFLTTELLLEHRVKHNEQLNHYCTYCSKRFLRLRTLLLHQRTHNLKAEIKSEPTEDSNMDVGCNSPSDIQTHIIQKTVNKCNLCLQTFPSSLLLADHMKMQHIISEKKFQCQYCPSYFRTAYDRIQHEKSHLNIMNPFQCQYCAKVLRSKNSKQTHERIHTGERPYSCNICDEKFLQQATKNYHMKKFHKNQIPQNSNKNSKIYDAELKCRYCFQEFRQESKLKVHEERHFNDKPHKCEFCEKEFNFKSKLFYHLRTHTGEKPFKCRFCDKSFSQKGGSKEHEKSHIPGYKPKNITNSNNSPTLDSDTNERVLQVNNNQLNLPQNSVPSNNSFKCKYCEETFMDDSTRDLHQSTHSGVKPFACEECGQGFVNYKLLKLHLEYHERQKNKPIIKCDMCDKG